MPIGVIDDPPSPATNASDNRSVADSVTSENSIHFNPSRPQMDVACVIDLHQPEHLSQRKRALEELKIACNQINAQLHHITVECPVSVVSTMHFALMFAQKIISLLLILVWKVGLWWDKYGWYFLQCWCGCDRFINTVATKWFILSPGCQGVIWNETEYSHTKWSEPRINSTVKGTEGIWNH